jgi:hypothetical protein
MFPETAKPQNLNVSIPRENRSGCVPPVEWGICTVTEALRTAAVSYVLDSGRALG